MHQGWVKIHRKSMDSSVWKNPVVWMVWSWCLLEANHEVNKFPFNGSDIEILPGEFITGRESAMVDLKRVGITEQRWRTAMSYLKSTSRITIKTTNKFSLVKINNWTEYQQVNQQTNQPLTNEQPTTNQQLTTNKNVKNVKKDKNDKNNTLATSVAGVQEVMAAFYEINPGLNFGNKTQREAAEWLLGKFGLEKTLNTIRYAETIHEEQYAPTITTPLQLKEKLGALIAYSKKNKPLTTEII